MNAMTSGAHAGLDKHAPHPVDGHPDYEWYEDALGGERHTVYWVPAVDAILDVGTVRPNPERTTTNQIPALLAEDADGEWIASGATVPALARVLVLHHRTTMLAAQHANAAVDALVAESVMDTADWQLCVELADFPTWRDEFGPVGRLLSGTDGTPTIDTLLRDLGVDPDQEGRPDGHLRPSLELAYERTYEQAWHSALVRIARSRVRTP
jgi:hypothetical protein